MFIPSDRFPDQRLTRIEALRGNITNEFHLNGFQITNYVWIGFTIDPTYASFSEKDLGSLETGKLADYVVLSQDIMTIPVHKILDTKILATVIDGRPAFGNI